MEAESLVERDGRLVRLADLERVLGARAIGPIEEPLEQRGRQPLAEHALVDRHVHQVPHRVVARADQVADDALVPDGGQADPRRLRQLENEHRQRPRRGEGATLDGDHLRQVRIGQAPDLERGGQLDEGRAPKPPHRCPFDNATLTILASIDDCMKAAKRAGR